MTHSQRMPELAEDADELAALPQRLVQVIVVQPAEREGVLRRGHLRYARAIGPGHVRHRIERRQPHANLEPRNVRANAGDHVAEKARAILERAAVFAWPGACAQQLVTEIAVTVLDVHELESQLAREPCGLDEIEDEPIELVIGDDVHAGRKLSIEQRMRVGHDRIGSILGAPARESSRMRELQTDEQIARRRLRRSDRHAQATRSFRSAPISRAVDDVNSS